MSLGIAFKGAEGIVLAADSRVTLMAQMLQPGAPGTPPAVTVIPATFDNATKLLRVDGQKYVAAVTYGVGTLGQQQPRTAHSFMPEFEQELKASVGTDRISVEAFAQRLSQFFNRQWTQHMPANVPPGNDMVFLVGGYDEDQPYGRLFEIWVPSNPTPQERHAGDFGIVWGGQREHTDRLISGFDPNIPEMIKQHLNLTDAQRAALEAHLRSNLQVPIPFPFLPLQDCVDLAIFLIRTTITLQKFIVGVRGVGGAIDIATITRTAGIEDIQTKRIAGEIDPTEISGHWGP